MKVLLLTKDHNWGRAAAEIARNAFGHVTVCAGKTGTPYPAEASAAQGDAVLSYLSPWVLPAAELARFALALNFHPGSSRYPGSGCYNFALYEDAADYGCVCHHMLAISDTGAIVDERLFPIARDESVETLQLKCLTHMTAQFKEICRLMARGERFGDARSTWQRKPTTMRGFEALKRLTPEISPEEVRKRVRAAFYPGTEGAYYLVGGVKREAAPAPPGPAIAFR